MAWYTEETELEMRRQAAAEARWLEGLPGQPGGSGQGGGALNRSIGSARRPRGARPPRPVGDCGAVVREHRTARGAPPVRHRHHGRRLVAADLAERLDALLVPVVYGVTPIHAGHPGTISLRRRVFEEYVANGEELAAMGASVLVLVNWHEGNIASLDAVATDLQDRHGMVVVAAQACSRRSGSMRTGWRPHPWRGDRDDGGDGSRP